jgi:hypothetical protein
VQEAKTRRVDRGPAGRLTAVEGRMSTATRIVPSLMVMMLPPSLAGAQELYIYPSKGQSASQQSKDQEECHHWAVKQTGIDPSRPVAVQAPVPPPPQPEAPQGGLLRGAARGSASSAGRSAGTPARGRRSQPGPGDSLSTSPCRPYFESWKQT